MNRELIVSGTVDEEDSTQVQRLNSALGIDEIGELELPFLEADMQLIPHIHWELANFREILSLSILMILMSSKYF